MLESKRAISPLIATVLLIVFSVALGAVVMSWGESYIEEKAEFVSGVQEIGGGCDRAAIDVIRISGAPQVCAKEGVVDVWLDNGPAADIENIHVRVVGTQGVATAEDILEAPLLRGEAARATIGTGQIGGVRQVKLTPKVRSGAETMFCSAQALLLENIQPCQ